MANIENKDPKKDIKKRMVKALFSYTPVNSDELTLKINDILEVIEETEEGWWKGILEGNIGMFPSNFVIELDGYPEELNNKLMNELSPSKNISKAKNVSQQQETLNKHGNNILIQNKQDSKQGVMNSTNVDAVDGSSSSKNATDPLPEKKLITAKKPPVDSAAPRLPPKPVREQAQVIFPYESQNEDELSLKEGDIITVLSKEIEDKGWWRGELNNKIGVFPDNFVKLIKAEEQKKPERPDKPPAVIASKNSLKSVSSEKGTSESSPKLEKKVLKTPPAKPPPPEIHKKEPERPLLPCPSKKPQPMQPVKKPTRSSLGPKLPLSPVISAAKSSVSESGSPIPTSFPSSSEKTEESLKVENTTDKDNKHKKEMEFDLIEPTSKKLVHLTANRAKAPNRRPPSFIFLKENERDQESHTTDRRLSEPLLAEFNALLPLNESQKKSAISASNVEIKPKVPPSRPSPPIAKSNSLTKQDTVLISKKEIRREDSVVKPQDSGKKDSIPDKVPVLTKEILHPNKIPELPSQIDSKSSFFKVQSSVATVNPELPSQLAPKVSSVKIPLSIAAKTSTITTPAIPPNAPSEDISAAPLKNAHHIVTKPPATLPSEMSSSGAISLETQVLDIKEDLKVVRNNMVSKNDYNALLKQVTELKVLLEMYNKNCTKAISDLKEELNEERRLRCSVELELQKLKECQNT
ncbi:SH3 domain-containing kinase-binding protein 1 [Trichonephila clavata]|uniref:SH3 domain-containing kinase-binding protein 1 n=1 Tax=Trichonephila clavata TaxID=2740835 RepID=A0A8X6KA08_TRICU|nr:SH3 domain-containing kinase-binding protein 1 [Trichonephila clavata]